MKIVSGNAIPSSFYQEVWSDEQEIVQEIIDTIRLNGDQAVRYYMKKFDNLSLDSYEISDQAVKLAYENTNEDVLSSIKFAANNIQEFAELQFSMYRDLQSNNLGYTYGQKIIPINRVGCYVPGGNYPLPSTALMTVIPAKVAGVSEIVVCSPRIDAVTIIAADIAGATQIYNLGGAQAIAAMAYGTKSISKVDKIVGPGNKFVNTAKKIVFGKVGIDMIAGPSEIMIIADDSGDPEIIAADLLAQAEHDELAQSNLLTTSLKLAENVNEEVLKQIEELDTKSLAKISIENSYIIITDTLEEAVKIANNKAPEHLEIHIEKPDQILPKLRNFGSLFIGKYSAEVFGDYCTGPNHSLPTNQTAKYSGGLSVNDFIKIVTYQKVNKKALRKLIDSSVAMAELEGLSAHKNAALKRKKFI